MGTILEQEQIENRFIDKLLEQIIRDIGIDTKYQQFFTSNMSDIVYNKTNNSSILGSMNDFKNTIRYCSESEPIQAKFHISTINSINIMPMSYIKYAKPIEAMKEELELRIKQF